MTNMTETYWQYMDALNAFLRGDIGWAYVEEWRRRYEREQREEEPEHEWQKRRDLG